MDLWKPRGNASLRNPTSNEQKHGQIYNPPRYATFGGLSGATKATHKNSMTLSRPGDTKKVI